MSEHDDDVGTAFRDEEMGQVASPMPTIRRKENCGPCRAFLSNIRGGQEFAIAAIYFYGAVFTMTFIMNFVHYRMPNPKDNKALPDIVHDNIPFVSFGPFGELIFYINTFIMIGAAANYWRWNVLVYMLRFQISWASCWFIRCIALLATSLPPTTNFYCRFAYPTPEDFPHPIDNIYLNTLIGVLSFGNGNVHCGDLMYSGHTVLVTHVWLMMATYFRHSPFLLTISTVLSIAKLAMIIIERQHYTIDVLVSLYVSITIFKLTPEHHLPWFLAWMKRCCCRQRQRAPNLI